MIWQTYSDESFLIDFVKDIHSSINPRWWCAHDDIKKTYILDLRIFAKGWNTRQMKTIKSDSSHVKAFVQYNTRKYMFVYDKHCSLTMLYLRTKPYALRMYDTFNTTSHQK